jgi:hypothetical protein
MMSMLVRAGLPSRRAAMAAVQLGDADFLDGAGMREWLESEAIIVLTDAGNWPTPRRERYGSDSGTRHSAAQFSAGTVLRRTARLSIRWRSSQDCRTVRARGTFSITPHGGEEDVSDEQRGTRDTAQA